MSGQLENERRSHLAYQIKNAVCQDVQMAPVDQGGRVKFCRGPEELSVVFGEALKFYPTDVYHLKMSLVLMHISNRQELQDQIGHRAYKRLLHKLEPILIRSLRSSDVVVRCGRDDYAFLVLGAGANVAAAICSRLKESIRRACYLSLHVGGRIDLEFAALEHDPNSDGLISDIFATERLLSMAVNLGDGAIVTENDLSQSFTAHKPTTFRIGECGMLGGNIPVKR